MKAPERKKQAQNESVMDYKYKYKDASVRVGELTTLWTRINISVTYAARYTDSKARSIESNTEMWYLRHKQIAQPYCMCSMKYRLVTNQR